jgi:Reverse transcriptase (RNA-dependent DNA polymerase).
MVFFCDVQKAFDCICYDIFLSKMEFYGISGEDNKLIQSYLNNRYQRGLLENNSMKYFLNGSQLNVGFHKAQYLDHYFFYCILMIFKK